MMTTCWSVLRTSPRCEQRAATALEHAGYEYFLPTTLIPKASGGKSTQILFPGYIFVQRDQNNHELPMIQTLPGVMGWLRFGRSIPTVPEYVLSELKDRVQQINRNGGLWTRFELGDTVIVTSGKLEALAEVLERPRSPETRIRVLMDFMGRQVTTVVPCHRLKPVSKTFLKAPREKSRRTRGKGRWIRSHVPEKNTPQQLIATGTSS